MTQARGTNLSPASKLSTTCFEPDFSTPLWSAKLVQLRVIAIQSGGVVVPMDRHGQGVGDKRARKGVLKGLIHWLIYGGKALSIAVFG